MPLEQLTSGGFSFGINAYIGLSLGLIRSCRIKLSKVNFEFSSGELQTPLAAHSTKTNCISSLQAFTLASVVFCKVTYRRPNFFSQERIVWEVIKKLTTLYWRLLKAFIQQIFMFLLTELTVLAAQTDFYFAWAPSEKTGGLPAFSPLGIPSLSCLAILWSFRT